MTAEILDGKKVAEEIRAGLKREVAIMKQKPGLAAIILGNDPASRIYMNIKHKACAEVGIQSELYELPETTTEAELLRLIRKLNNNTEIHGILVQLPLPKHVKEQHVFAAIAVEKDVDGLNERNMGRLMAGDEKIVPCTPKGIIRLLEHYRIKIEGQNAVVVGASNVVGRPTALMLLNRNATVSLCHIKTRSIADYTRLADILVVAAGSPCLIKAGMVKDGVVVIDVGINRVGNKIIGDVDFEAVREKASYITPVPGGVGPMTVAMLLENTVEACKNCAK
ncbi:bifunctional 5,10-methylene-tetrahydrofolate dehydrogenase/5,10-methylene-tetrahydrofolate cyclohydrolase [Candidatus Woesearchaeota archaeon CG1_02_47_18]|nr:MAG: bifunctional 5,10-methylene-tetrahydrofolate dehydrogenase/5,10-methylene-tetrahydrofolate cyclohydrolase [Candidatus Woesearchaeota archaeon CG1_02_47_18]HII30163.1 bifunctional methylenetetrahydrofolate dehydrogenase/methenyltetrahydrofolate cyclohydrolase FolD [Candidatus Woesearchaeota archaeon]